MWKGDERERRGKEEIRETGEKGGRHGKREREEKRERKRKGERWAGGLGRGG